MASSRRLNNREQKTRKVFPLPTRNTGLATKNANIVSSCPPLDAKEWGLTRLAISEARNAAKKNGEHMSTEEIKKVVQKNDSRNKLVRDVNKTFGEFSKNAPSSISASAHNSFFDRLYDDEY